MNFNKLRILVIGDKCEDHYTYGNVTRLCPDVPAPVFNPITTTQTAGMAGNVARQLEEWGCNVDKKFNEEFICKHKYIDEKTNHTFLRVDTETSVQRIQSDELRQLVTSATDKWDAIIVSDYGKGYLHFQDIKTICEAHPLVFIDTKKTLDYHFKGCAFIKINEPEWEATKHSVDLKSYCTYTDGKTWEDKIIVTLGDTGCMYKNNVYPVDAVDVFDLSGAGDTFMCGLVVSYILEKSIDKAIHFANKCSVRAVRKKGVATIEV